MDQIIALVGLILIFVLAFWRKLPMGAVALSFAYFLGVFHFGFEPKEISAGFPGHLIVTLIGVTYLFGIGHVNGTVDQIVATMVRLVRGRVVWIPWVFFLLAMAITASGALSVATLSILIPIGMGFAIRNKINPLIMGLSIINGTNAGGFSPVAVYYLIISGVLSNEGIELDPIPIFILTFLCSLLINIAAFFIFGGHKLFGRSGADMTIDDGKHTPHAWKPEQLLTIGTMLAVIASTLLLGQDVGYMAVTGAIILAMFQPERAQEGLKRIGWGIVLLIGGMVTYINVLSSAGVITDLAHGVANFSTPLIAALILIFISAFITAFASSNAMFVIIAPLAAPLLLAGEIGVIGFVVALMVSVVASDACPISTAGALVAANVPDHYEQRVFNSLFIWAMSMVVIISLLTWFLFVVIPHL